MFSIRPLLGDVSGLVGGCKMTSDRGEPTIALGLVGQAIQKIVSSYGATVLPPVDVVLYNGGRMDWLYTNNTRCTGYFASKRSCVGVRSPKSLSAQAETRPLWAGWRRQGLIPGTAPDIRQGCLSPCPGINAEEV